MSIHSLGYTQKDTLYTIDDSFDELVKASARDSMVHDQQHQLLHLYGEAFLYYEDIVMSADYILVDFTKNEVLASYTYDKDSNRIGLPKFTDGSEEIIAAKIRYNFDTKKGFIHEVKLKQDENYLYMEVAKRHANEEVHFKKGRFTTCDLEEPHYHFQLSKAILIPEKRIVSGPMNLWIKGVPTPIGLPFAFIPQKKIEKRKSGLLFPEVSVQSPYGMGFQNLGYYIPINDSLHTTVYGDLYTRGTWGLRNETEYRIKYKFSGNFTIGYQRLKQGFLDTLPVKKFTLIWTHRQDQKANPLWSFSTSINFMSDNNPKANLNPLNQNYFQNALNSDINIGRVFPGKPITLGLKLSARQNSISKTIALTSPIFNLNVTRFSPFAKLRKNPVGGKKWYEQIFMTYNLEGQNKSLFADSLLKNNAFKSIGEQFMNGFQQQTTLQTTLNLFKSTFKINPSLNYATRANFQQIRKNYDQTTNGTQTDTIQQMGISQNVSLNVQATTVLYAYYKFIGKKKPLLRQVITPSITYRYVPLVNKLITDSVGVNKSLVTYNPFERSIYSENSLSNSSIINFGLNNTLELKFKSDKDTVTGFKKIKLIDALTVNGSYDLLKDSMKWSRISSNLRISPASFLSFVASGTFSPYDFIDSSNVETKAYLYNERGKLVRLYNTSLNTSFIVASKLSREKISENGNKLNNDWNADFNYYNLHPDQFIDFDIPWKMTFTHVLSLNRSSKPFEDGKAFTQTQTLALNGDISITKRWKILVDSYYDIPTKRIINTRLTFTRDMHCWNLAFFWTPIGNNQSFLFRIAANASLFKDAKLELRKPPGFN